MPKTVGAVLAWLRPRKSAKKKFLRFCPHNSLKRLDSDERIQGNPIVTIGGFRGETATRQENPNRSPGANAAGRPRRRPTLLHPNPKRPTQRLSLLTATVNCHFLPES